MLTTSQSAAIHCALILGLPEPQAAKLAGIPIDQAQAAIGQIEPVVRGRKIDFSRWLTAGDSVKDPVQSDSRLLYYEIQLGRLEYQHDECVCSWRRTKEHADRLHEQLTGPLDAKGNPQKPFVGDIRFLQLAKNIRREMEKIEKLIAERLDELQKLPAPQNQPTASDQPKSITHIPLPVPSIAGRGHRPSYCQNNPCAPTTDKYCQHRSSHTKRSPQRRHRVSYRTARRNRKQDRLRPQTDPDN